MGSPAAPPAPQDAEHERTGTMFAVIRTGGKQYRVEAGQRLTIEKLAAEAGETVQFNEVLLLGGDDLRLGTPLVEDAAVQASVVEQTKGEKVLNFKRRRRKSSSRRLKGHRQHLTVVEVTDILAEGGASSGVKDATGARAARRTGQASPAAQEKPAEAEAKPRKAKAPKASTEGRTAATEVEARPPANLLDGAKGEPDDLTRLSGVGPKLQQKLNDNGVFHFWQIAEWTEAEVAHMDEQLSFKGRIQREDWIGQAKTFAAASE